MIKTFPQLLAVLSKQYPISYSHSTKAMEPPCIFYLDEGEDNYHADDKIYVEGAYYRFELYTKKDTIPAVNQLKNLFKSNGIIYEKDPTLFIKEEGLFLTAFTVKLNN